MKKNIGYLVPEFPSQTHVFFWREINAMRQLGRSVHIFSTRHNHISKVKHSFAIQAAQECCYTFPPGLGAYLFVFMNLIWTFRAIGYALALDAPLKEKLKTIALIPSTAILVKHAKIHQIEHIHGHSCASVAHMLAMAERSKVLTYSLTLHGKLGVYGTCHKEKMANATFVSAVTRVNQKQVQAIGFPLERIPVIWMGVDLNAFTIRDYKNDDGAPLRLISVARLDKGKGHRFALEALARLNQSGVDFHYDIIGSGDYEPEIRDCIASLNLNERVTLHGTMGEEQVRERLRDANALLLTSVSDFEAAPVCVMEAMASGVPAICSIVGGTPDMIDDGVDGFLVEQKNVDQIHDCIVRFANDRSLCERMGRAARMSAEGKFCHIKQAEKIVAAIDNLSNG